MIGKKYSFYEKGIKHTRQVLSEFWQYGRRLYNVKDLATGKQSEAIADDVDKYFRSEKGEVRKSKYTDQPFQKAKVKAGGF